jgi:hypothetical protein
MLMSPVKGWLRSNMRRIADAADKANRKRQVTTVTFRGESKLKFANMIMSQNARTARNGIGIRFSDSTNSNIATWGAAVYCAWVVRKSLLVGGAKLTLRNDAARASKS